MSWQTTQILSFVAGNFGGITRDLLIGAVPPAAISDWRYLAVSIPAGAVTFGWFTGVNRLQSAVLLFDAAGLALFAVSGTQKALAFGRTAAAFENEERRRKLQRQKREVAAAKVRARRKTAIENAEAALEDAHRQHHENAALIESDREMLEHRAQDEEKRWQKLKSRLEANLRKAGR